MKDEKVKPVGKAIECAKCWAHPKTARLCYCAEVIPTPTKQ